MSELRTRLTFQDFVEQFASEFDGRAALTEDLTGKRYIDKFDLRNAYEALKRDYRIVYELRADAQMSLGITRAGSDTRT